MATMDLFKKIIVFVLISFVLCYATSRSHSPKKSEPKALTEELNSKLEIKPTASPKNKSDTIRKPKGKTKTTEKTLKEFALQHLLDVGISSNEANKFIRSNIIHGKPLEQQYERTRETDMNAIERRVFSDLKQIRHYFNQLKKSNMQRT